MRIDDLIARYPTVYHVAADGSWPSIAIHGLLCSDRLCDLFGVNGEGRDRLISQHRPESVEIAHPDHGTAVIRDQKPMSIRGLERCLTNGVTPREWFQLLNSQVFFWATEARRDSMLNAQAYRRITHTVLTVDTSTLLELVGDNARLSRINSGSTLFNPVPRGRDLFVPVADYPSAKFAELTVPGGVEDIDEAVLAVERRAGRDIVETLLDRR